MGSVLSPGAVAGALVRLREQVPLVQCLTNIVVAQWSANVLLAAGAAPAMVDHPDEAGLFAGIASGVLVNTGTVYPDTIPAMRAAANEATRRGTPWVLDPVAVGVLPARTGIAVEVLALGPSIIRGNASEISALSGGAAGRGVDATASPQQVLGMARTLAATHGSVVAVSGPVDHITDGERLVTIGNGDPVMTKMTGVGCSLGALMAGFAAVAEPLLAATSATALMTVAAERAAARAQGPGSFAVALLDQLAAVSPDELAAAVQLG